MKKSFTTLAILLLVIVLCLNSCNVLNVFDVHTVTLTGNRDQLSQPLAPFYKVGEVVQIKLHKVICAGVYVYLNNERLSSSGYDEKYVFYEFEMPAEDVTVHLTFDPFYGREKYSFDELLYWVEYLETGVGEVPINGVSLTIDNHSDEASFIEKRFSTKAEVIDSFKAITKQPLIKVDAKETCITDTSITYTFYCANNPYKGKWVGDLNFEDNFFSHRYNETSLPQPFRFEDSNYVLPTIDDPDYVTYSFRREYKITYVKKYGDDSVSIRYDYMEAVDFVPYEGSEIDIEPCFYIDNKYGRINILNATVFELNGKYYEVVSGPWAYTYLNLDSMK